jgi:hypothetical protein
VSKFEFSRVANLKKAYFGIQILYKGTVFIEAEPELF